MSIDNKGKGKRVGIVGAGLSGLLACKYVLSKGFTPIVFESRTNIGGVWIKTLEITKLQTPKPAFQFSDFPWPDSVTQDFPDQSQVLDYIHAYAAHFQLIPHIRFNRKVVSLRHTHQGQVVADFDQLGAWALDQPAARGKWFLTVHQHDTQQSDSHEEVEVEEVDFVILCVGRFSDVPNIPEFEAGKGPEEFEGKVMHSMEYADMDNTLAAQMVKGKRVAVVGFQKNAMDIAFQCSIANGVEYPCTVLYRTKHWNLPDYLPWGIPLAFLYLNRFSELLVHKPAEGFLLCLLATLLSPLRWAFAKFVEADIKKKHRLAKFGMVPKHSFLKELSSCTVASVPEGFYDRVEKGSIELKEALYGFGFWKEGILINNGTAEPEKIKVDMVILGTGFRGVDKLKDTFSSLTFRDYITGSENNTVPLYRECIHPRIPQLAVIGFSESVSNLYTSEIRGRWVAELIDGRVKLPGIKEMEKNIAAWDEYMKRYSGENFRRSCIGALHIWYNDQLCRDMGWNPKRKSGFLSDLFLPYGPLDYTHP